MPERIDPTPHQLLQRVETNVLTQEMIARYVESEGGPTQHDLNTLSSQRAELDGFLALPLARELMTDDEFAALAGTDLGAQRRAIRSARVRHRV